MSLTDDIKTRALELGFDLIGIAPAGVAPHAAAYSRWIEQGYHGEMHWMARDPARRMDPRVALPGAQSLVVVGMSYFTQNPPPEIWDDPARGRIARYAWGRDYHKVMTPLLRQLGEFVDAELGASRSQRSYVDTGPVLEKDFASKAGIGFVGKNSLVINPGFGSYFFLGEILIDIELEYDSPFTEGEMRYEKSKVESRKSKVGKGKDVASFKLQDANFQKGELVELKAESLRPKVRKASCGSCTRCLDACPTKAIVSPYVLDSNLCISYHTIENKGTIPEPLRGKFGNWIYGCDVCQEVCPWVQQYSRPGGESFLAYDPDKAAPLLSDLLTLSEEQFRERFRGTPIVRTKRRGLLRNVAIALTNWGSGEALELLRFLAKDEEPLVREHALWGMGEIEFGR